MSYSFAAAVLSALVFSSFSPAPARADVAPGSSSSGALNRPGVAAAAFRHGPRCADGADLFVRTELFFGLSRPGGVVRSAERAGSSAS